jgi:hypothetical protein
MNWKLSAVSVLLVSAVLAAGCSKSEPEDVAPAAAPAATEASDAANTASDTAAGTVDSAAATVDSAAVETTDSMSMPMPSMDSVGAEVGDSVAQ